MHSRIPLYFRSRLKFSLQSCTILAGAISYN